MKDIKELGEKVMLYDWMETWLNVYSKYRVKENTYDCYAAGIGWVKKCIEDQELRDINEVTVQTGLNFLCDLGYSKSTIRKAQIVLNQSFKKAIKNHYMSENPVIDTYIPYEAGEKDIKPLTREEQVLVERACYEDLNGLLMLFLLNTGLRRFELCNLKWDDYDRKNKCIYVRKSKSKSGVRAVPLLPICEQIIIAQPKINEYIFNSTIKKPITDSVLKKTYLRIRKVTGVKTLTNHVCRHTFATRLLENGASPKAISLILGNSSVAFTMVRYTFPDFEYLAQQILLMNKPHKEYSH